MSELSAIAAADPDLVGKASPANKTSGIWASVLANIDLIVVIGLIALYGAFFSALTIARHEAFDSGAFDLGFMDQAAWNTLRGDIMGVTIEPWLARTHLGYHFDPILIPISLSYLIYSNPASLLVVQSVGLALGAWPAAMIARRRLGSGIAPVVFALAYLLYPGLQAANVYDFHAFSLAAPLILACFYAIEARRPVLFVVFAVLTMATKENVPLTTAMLAIYWVYRELADRRKITRSLLWLCASVFALSIVWFYFGTYVVVPYFNAEGQKWLWSRYGDMGGSPITMLAFFFQNPGRLIEPAPDLSNLSYLVKLLFPLGFLTLLSPISFLVAAPALATNMLTIYAPMHMLETYHYTSALVPSVVYSAILGAHFIVKGVEWGGRRLRLSVHDARLARRLVFVLICFGILACSLVYHYYRGYTPISPGFAWPQIEKHHAIGRSVFERIPPEAVLSAQGSIYPHVSQRDNIWMFPYVGEAEYILLDVVSQPNSRGYDEGFHGVLRDYLSKPEFGAVIAEDGFVLLKRGAPHVDLPDSFFSFARAENPSPQTPLRVRFEDKDGPAIELVGFDLRTARDAQADLSLYWKALRPLKSDYFLPIYQTDGQGKEVGATLNPQPVNYWYPTSRWKEGEIVRVKTVALPWFPGGSDYGLAIGATEGLDPWDAGKRLRPIVEEAGYRTLLPGDGTLVELVHFDNDRGLIRWQKTPRDATEPLQSGTTRRESGAVFGESIRLESTSLTVRGEAERASLDLRLDWKAIGRPAADYTVFVHVLDSQGKLVAQADSRPLSGRAPTRGWIRDDRYADLYSVPLVGKLAAGEDPSRLSVLVGLYQPESGNRLPVTDPGAGPTNDDKDAILLIPLR